MSDSTKSRLGKYELLEEIGDGAEGRIFKARCVEAGVPDVSVGDFVALKRLRQTGNETQSAIFNRTSRILRALDHPNIVRYKDSFISTDDALDEEVYCLVTELLEGETLKELLDRNKTGLPWDRARHIVLSTLEALEYAGANSIIHRDLKPSNIYLTKNDDVKLIDFGIARHEDSGSTTTSTGTLLGSFDFMAPDFVLVQEENFRGDQQSDIFSFGVCFYQILTGALPFPPLGGNAQIAYFQRYVSADKIPKVKYNHPIFSVLHGARNCLEKCLTPSRENRYKTFSELLAAIKAIHRRTLQHVGGDKYEYLEYIGKGGFGKVFRARRLRDGLEVAVKEVLVDGNSSRFIREAKLLKMTRHPHLVQYLDFVELTDPALGEDRRLFLVLEYLPGMPESGMNYRIKMTPGGVDAVEVLHCFSAYLDCLDYLHQNTIIHRDIKPGNLYAPTNAPERGKIFDLGIAHDTEGTKTHGQIPGTLDYMPPEFASQDGARGSVQSDIYSLGVTLFQALTGKLPFDRLPEDEKMAWTNWYLRCEKPPPISYAHAVFTQHPDLKILLQRALAPRPQDRFSSAREMRDEVRKILANVDPASKNYEAATKQLSVTPALPSDAPPASVPTSKKPPALDEPPTAATVPESPRPFEPKSKAPIFAAIAAIVILLIGTGLWLLRGSHTKSVTTTATGGGSPPVTKTAAAEAAKNIPVANTANPGIALPLEISGLPTGMIVGTFGQNAARISFLATGGKPPLSLDYAFSPKLPPSGQTRVENIDVGERFSISVPQGIDSRHKLTATITDAAGHKVSARSQIQFIPTNSIGMPLVWIPEMPVDNALWMDVAAGGWAGRYEVTQEEFAYLMGVNPSEYKTGGRFPVENMSYDQATRFCEELTRRDGQMLPKGWHYSLPTQAQWEFFAAGTPVDTAHAYFIRSKPQPTAPEEVGLLKLNSFGLYDVLGNVAELTSTHYPTGAKSYLCLGGGFKSGSTSEVADGQAAEADKQWMLDKPRLDVGFRVVVVPRN